MNFLPSDPQIASREFFFKKVTEMLPDLKKYHSLELHPIIKLVLLYVSEV
jgi:hypothetical protein